MPPVGDTVPDYEASGWFGIGAPKGVPVGIVERLGREVELGLADPATSTRLAELGATPLQLGPTAFGAFLAGETEKWARIVKISGARPD